MMCLLMSILGLIHMQIYCFYVNGWWSNWTLRSSLRNLWFWEVWEGVWPWYVYALFVSSISDDFLQPVQDKNILRSFLLLNAIWKIYDIPILNYQKTFLRQGIIIIRYCFIILIILSFWFIGKPKPRNKSESKTLFASNSK